VEKLRKKRRDKSGPEARGDRFHTDLRARPPQLRDYQQGVPRLQRAVRPAVQPAVQRARKIVVSLNYSNSVPAQGSVARWLQCLIEGSCCIPAKLSGKLRSWLPKQDHPPRLDRSPLARHNDGRPLLFCTFTFLLSNFLDLLILLVVLDQFGHILRLIHDRAWRHLNERQKRTLFFDPIPT